MFNANMPYRNLGKNGIKVSQFSLGGWTTFGGTVKDATTIHSILHLAYESGINFFDIADVYAKGESELMMGAVLREFPRHELVISSKVFWPMSDDINDKGLSRKHIHESIHKSLKRIGTDYLDIYYCHRYDTETPVEETVRIMDDLIHQGKILYWGTSEWTGQQIQEAIDICEKGGYYKPAVEQPQYNLLVREKMETDVIAKAVQHGMGLTTWSPLASGLLSGKYDDGIKEGRLSKIEWLKDTLYTEDNVRKVKAMKKIADEMECSRSQLALAWIAAQKGISSVILGATRIEQLQENLGALKVNITPEVDRELKQLFK
ncbi:aldo/keto reductase family protein [Bdellovibrio sp. HCB2-146]|uniref:aldo/keto reductase family protein n=1 Tax=Bdellovibrio sp. HCB2-146 TaxID=3394362 RepID=UPI0039BC2D63